MVEHPDALLGPAEFPRPVEILVGTTWIPATAHADRRDSAGAWILASYRNGRTTTLAWILNSHIRPPRSPG
jgi:hypothetical protein